MSSFIQEACLNWIKCKLNLTRQLSVLILTPKRNTLKKLNINWK